MDGFLASEQITGLGSTCVRAPRGHVPWEVGLRHRAHCAILRLPGLGACLFVAGPLPSRAGVHVNGINYHVIRDDPKQLSDVMLPEQKNQMGWSWDERHTSPYKKCWQLAIR